VDYGSGHDHGSRHDDAIFGGKQRAMACHRLTGICGAVNQHDRSAARSAARSVPISSIDVVVEVRAVDFDERQDDLQLLPVTPSRGGRVGVKLTSEYPELVVVVLRNGLGMHDILLVD